MNVVVIEGKYNWVKPHHQSQSGQGCGQGIKTDASRLNQGSRGGTGFHDQPTAVDDISNKTPATCQGKSFPLKIGSIVLCTTSNSNSYEHVASRRICKGSYESGDLRDTGTLTAGVDDTSSMTSFAERFAEIPIRNSSISGSYSDSTTIVGSDSGSDVTFASASSTTVGSGSAATSDSGSGPVSTFAAMYSSIPFRMSSKISRNSAKRRCGAYRVWSRSCKTNQHQ